MNFPSPNYFACLNVKIEHCSSEEGCAEEELVSEWETGRARLPGPRLGEGSRQPRSRVSGMREDVRAHAGGVGMGQGPAVSSQGRNCTLCNVLRKFKFSQNSLVCLFIINQSQQLVHSFNGVLACLKCKAVNGDPS